MGQVLHGCATTTAAVRRAIRHSQASLRALAKRYGINPKTVAKWKSRAAVGDLKTGLKEPRSTSLSVEEEAIIVAFRRHTLLPLDDCLCTLQATIPRLTRSSLHNCLQRHGISRLPEVEGDKTAKAKFKSYPIGYFPIDIAEVRTADGKLYLFVAIDRTSKFAYRPASSEGHDARRRRRLARPHQSRAVQGPHRPHRQRRSFHRSQRQRMDAGGAEGKDGARRALQSSFLRIRLPATISITG